LVRMRGFTELFVEKNKRRNCRLGGDKMRE
jgi:hypothetical protein